MTDASAADLEIAGLHALLFGLGGLLLALPAVATDLAAWTFVATYNGVVPLYAHYRGRRRLLKLWLFTVPLSLFQVLPDWFLAAELGTLRFPGASGGWPVPHYMAGLWTAPLVPTLHLALRLGDRRRGSRSYIAAAGAGLVVFGVAEWLLTGAEIWVAVGVETIAGVAPYILVAEVLLCASTLYAFRATRGDGPAAKIGAAALVAVTYLGAACTSYLVVDRWLLGM